MTRPWASGDQGHIASHNNLPIFAPKDFGALADGSDDTAALQAAIDAAANEGGGIVDGAGLTYVHNIAGVTGIGTYANVTYGLKISASNIYLRNLVLKLAAVPDWTGTRFVSILFDAVGPQATNPVNGGTWLSNVGIERIFFDNSALTKTETKTMTAGNSACVNFSHCRGFLCKNNKILKGFGEGSIHTILGSIGGDIVGNLIEGASHCGMWLDGLRASNVYGNRVLGEIYYYGGDAEYAIEGVGIDFAANTDNQTGSEYNNVHHNELVNCKSGAIAGVIDTSHIHNNLVVHDNGTGVYPFKFSYAHNVQGLWTCHDLRIEDNTIISVSNNIPTGKAIYVYGATNSLYDSSVVDQEHLIIKGNRVNSNWGTEIELGEHVNNSFVVNNFINGNSVIEDATCLGNIIVPNY